MSKEAIARIKINKLLQNAGWRFFDNDTSNANIQLEANTKITKQHLDALGNNFEKTTNGFVDFLLLDKKGYPLVVLEAKREGKSPLDGKEQARRYANSLNVRFVILSNGDLHYFWDLEKGNPEIITEFPTQESIGHRQTFKPNPLKLADAVITEDYIAITQNPMYKSDPRWIDEKKRNDFINESKLRFLRPYQLRAIKALQESARNGNDRYLFEMATGTGKTLVSAAVIKLFLKSGNASRILFLVDRLELEDQARKNFINYLKNDYTTVVYKEHRDDWRKAEIVVSTVQSLSFDDKYRRIFSPIDFDLIISDEAHRSIGGNSRAVFEYFVGYKLGLTATPKNYLKNIDPNKLSSKDPRAWEKRQLLDTYVTFGCEKGKPTFTYSLIDGVKDGYLINPIVADARTEITTQLLSDKGYAVTTINEEGEDEEVIYYQKDFERKLISDTTNKIFCKTFLENALKDPISGEIGKSIVFCVSQDHAEKITQILNVFAHKLYPDKYNSDFAVQVTSRIPNAPQFTINFSNNNLNGHTKFIEGFKSSKTRVCVTVGMMTTGYDCQDILNLCLMRPIFSPTDFVQIKGRGTRTFTFDYKEKHQSFTETKNHFKLFDFFANCEYFEDKFDYDEVLELPKQYSGTGEGGGGGIMEEFENYNPDPLKTITESPVGLQGMKIDRKLFEKFATPVKNDPDIVEAIKAEQWDKAVDIIRKRYENCPELFITLDKLKRAENLDRRLTWKEVLQKTFGMIDNFKTKDELLEDEFNKFISIHKPDNRYILPIRNFMKAYISDPEIREIVDAKDFARLATNAKLTLEDLKSLNGWRETIPLYVKDYVPINTYLS